MRKVVLFVVVLLATCAVVAASAGATTDYPADCDYICMNEYYANQPYAGMPADTLDALDYKSLDSTVRCYHTTKYSGRGVLHEARRYSLYVRWCVKNNSKVTSWGYGLQYTSGTACHLSSYDTPYIYGGALGTSAIYVTSRAHFACDVGFPYSPLTVHPDCWLNVRYGALGGSAVQSKGCDWV